MQPHVIIGNKEHILFEGYVSCQTSVQRIRFCGQCRRQGSAHIKHADFRASDHEKMPGTNYIAGIADPSIKSGDVLDKGRVFNIENFCRRLIRKNVEMTAVGKKRQRRAHIRKRDLLRIGILFDIKDDKLAAAGQYIRIRQNNDQLSGRLGIAQRQRYFANDPRCGRIAEIGDDQMFMLTENKCCLIVNIHVLNVVLGIENTT